MKNRILLLFTFCTLVSCNSPKYFLDIGYIDYTFFKDKGIFVTEGLTVNFDYETLGSLSVLERTGMADEDRESKHVMSRNTYNDVYDVGNNYSFSFKNSYTKVASLQSIYEHVYKEIKKIDGDGILNFKISYLPALKSKEQNLGSGLMISGMVIKRLKK